MHTEFIAHYLEPDKKPQSVQKHLQETSDAACVFAGKIGLSSMGEIAGLLHDFGKYSKTFQSYIRSAEGKLDPDMEPVDAGELKGKIDHSTAGAQMVWEALKDDVDPMSKFAAQVIALCVASHHSGLIDCLSPDGEDKFSVRMAKNKKETHLDEVQSIADKDILGEITNILHLPEYVTELKGQLKRLLSAEDSPEVREFYVGLLVRFVFSALIDADRLSAAGRSNTKDDPQWNLLIERLEQHISEIERRSSVDDIRSEVSLACREFGSREKGLYQLTVPTGGGKTLSSLRFGLHHAAHHQMDRLIYVIPYTTIIDQNAAVARLILEGVRTGEKDTVILEHHSNLTPEKETWQSRLLAENWDARVIFTTSVQFLEALFAGGTRGARRMHNLANSVIVFDEIQTLPVKTVHLFNNAINFLVKQCGSTVVFCTATQPLLNAVDLRKGAAKLTTNPEMAPRRDGLFKDMKGLRHVEVLDRRRNGGWKDSEIAHCISDEARDTGSVLAVVNTKAAARTLYDLCRQEVVTVFHLSTNMCPAHRLRIIDDIKKNLDPDNPEPKKPMVCVSTQLIEAGVDIDFGSVVRYLAGLDSIAQAAGRCNRNGRRPSGKVIVVNPSHESLDKLREIRIGKEEAERVLDEYKKNPGCFDNDLLSPKAMQRYYEYYFFNRAIEMAYRVSSKDIGHDDEMLNLLSANTLSVEAYKHATKRAPSSPLRQSFRSAGSVFKVIDAPTDGITVPYSKEGQRIIAALCAASDLEQIRRLLKDAQRYSVNLFPYDLEKLMSKSAIHETQKGSGIFYLDERYYHENMGVVFDPKESMGFLNT